jgi:ferredoxin-thioredoxin reductase catalytic subunit
MQLTKQQQQQQTLSRLLQEGIQGKEIYNYIHSSIEGERSDSCPFRITHPEKKTTLRKGWMCPRAILDVLKKRKTSCYCWYYNLECLDRNVVPSPSIMFGFRAASVVWTNVKAERLQHCHEATCYRVVSEKLPQEHGEERITQWPYGQGTSSLYSLPCTLELVGSFTTKHIYASSLSKPTPFKFMKKVIFPYPSLLPKLWLCMISRKNTWLTFMLSSSSYKNVLFRSPLVDV